VGSFALSSYSAFVERNSTIERNCPPHPPKKMETIVNFASHASHTHANSLVMPVARTKFRRHAGRARAQFRQPCQPNFTNSTL
jgi:hypothetical protein